MVTPRFGAWIDDRGAHFRLWAPSSSRAALLLDGRDPVSLTRDARGIFAADLDALARGTRYRYRLDKGEAIPDPASSWQPDGVHGASALDDARAFAWGAAPVPLDPRDLIIYELHTGTFTPEGTFDAARDRLPYLRELGVTAIELMPVAEFAGTRNWGYDGVALFAPSHAYGGPDALRRLVDDAHAHGLGVILDVVYNHVGPDGSYLHAASPEFFAADEASPWGAAVNIGHPVVRDWLVANALQWARDYRIDGFRLDATHALPRAHTAAFMRTLADTTRAESGRPLLFIAEDSRRMPSIFRRERDEDWGLDGVWADDFHHHVRVMTAGDSHGYFAAFSGRSEDLAQTMTHGWSLESPSQTDAPAVLAPFVVCIQNHDQVGNRALGDRLHHTVGLDTWRAASALLLLAAATPLLFMGQEWAASSPFQYFTDHAGDLGRLVSQGRRREFRDFPAFRDGAAVPDPQDEATFAVSRLRWDERETPPHAGVLNLYRTLVALRRSEQLLQPLVFAMDTHTVCVRYERIALVARLEGGGRVPRDGWLDAAWRAMLTTEDAPFTVDGAPPSIAPDAIDFPGPAAIVFRRG
ncbi:MAG: malto-oligosyltrehalose trehalohydrolase [Acidobacteria bacterium]|nr:malto-oligosyltrehalose trehalohydrolase [Acidobacteriota bacterium]